MRMMWKKTASMILAVAILFSAISVVSASEIDNDTILFLNESIFAGEEDVVLGNSSQNLLNGGVIAETENILYYTDNNAVWKIENNLENVVLNENAQNINISSDAMYYTVENKIKKFDFNDKKTIVLTEANSEIELMYLVNNKDVYYLSNGDISCYEINSGKTVKFEDSIYIHSFIPSVYGIIYAEGSLFNYDVYANQKKILEDVAEYYITDEILVYTKGGKSFQIDLFNVFYGFTADDVKPLQFDDEIQLFAENDDVEDNIEGAVIIDESCAATIEDDEMSCPVVLFSAGTKNIVKRARQQLEIKWMPQKNVVSYSSNTSGSPTTFKAGTTYSGIPYGQQVNSGKYVPHSYSLNNFIKAVNDKTSAFYTSRGSYDAYGMDSPYYASDCSAFVSWAYGMSRKTTSSLVNVTDKVSSQSVYSAKVGDCLNKPGSHVVLIADLIYDGNGDLTKVTIMEQTPPKAKKTTYTVATIKSKYLNNGYVLRRYPDAGDVKYTHYCAVSIDGDSCSKCKPVFSSATPNSSTSITVKWDALEGATSYKVGIKKSGDDDYTDYTTTSKSYKFDNLSAGSKYYFRLYGINRAWTSPRSETYMCYTKPKTPNAPTVERVNESKLTITWEKVPGATKYKLLRKLVGNDEYEVIKTTTAFKYEDSGLLEASKYYYKIIAVVEDGDSAGNDIESARSENGNAYTAFSRPSLPKGTINPGENNYVMIKMPKAHVPTSDTNYYYAIERKAPGESSYSTVYNGSDISAQTFKDTNVSKDNAYSYIIRLVRKEDGAKILTSTAFGVGPTMSSPILTSTDTNKLKVSWNLSCPENVTYRVYRHISGETEWSEIARTTSLSYVDETVKVGTKYHYYIAAFSSDGYRITKSGSSIATHEILTSTITLDKSSIELFVGESSEIKATVLPENATNKTVAWTTSNASVVAVENGIVIAKDEGTATITAAAGGKKATCQVVVKTKDVSAPVISDVNISDVSGEQFTFNCKLNDNVGVTRVWVAICDSSGNWYQYGLDASNGDFAHTVYTKDLAGEDTYIVHLYAYDAENNETKVEVNDIKAISVVNDAIAPTISNVRITDVSGEKFTFNCKLNDNVGVTRVWVAICDLNGTWYQYGLDVSNGDFAHTVYTKDLSGAGKYVMHLYAYDAMNNETKVEVNDINAVTIVDVEQILLDGSEIDLEIGETETLTATVVPENATDKTIIWTSSNEKVATVDNGVITAVSAGEAVITASAGGKSISCMVIVHEKAAESDAPVIYLTEATCKNGETVTVDVVLENNTGFANLEIELDYDTSVLTIVDVSGNANVGATFTKAPSNETKPYNMSWTSMENVYYNGTLATVTFKIADDAKSGNYAVKVDYYKGVNGDYTDGYDVNIDEDFNAVGFTYKDGVIVVENHIPGDINGDGAVNSRDSITLLRHLAGWSVDDIVIDAVDVNGDGAVNSRDSITLLRFLAGWDVEIY